MTRWTSRSRPQAGRSSWCTATACCLKGTIKGRTSALKHCYDTILQQNPEAVGKITYDISISTAGDVVSVHADATPSTPAALVECTLAKIRGWKFAPKGITEPANVRFSVVFSGR